MALNFESFFFTTGLALGAVPLTTDDDDEALLVVVVFAFVVNVLCLCCS
jgi:hypothetical protein